MKVPIGGYKASDLERKYITQVLDSGQLSAWSFTERFENEFAQLHDCKYAIFTNSGTSSLHIALQALKELHGWQDGDEVIVPAVTFVATANIVLHNRMRPVFVDIDGGTYNIDVDRIGAAITDKTRAIIPVHIAGLPAQMNLISQLQGLPHELKIITDSCETMFVNPQQKGDIECFSTYMCHILTTGVGGFCTTNNPYYAEKIRSLMNHGRDMGQRKRFKFNSIGHSFRATEFEAALGLAQLEQKDAMLNRRQEVASNLTNGLKQFEDRLQLPFVPKSQLHAFMFYPIVMRDHNESKEPIMEFLGQAGIETRDLLPLINQPCYQAMGIIEANYPVARWLNRCGFYIGCWPGMTNEQVDYVIEKFKEYFNK